MCEYCEVVSDDRDTTTMTTSADGELDLTEADDV